ncbi:MAG: MotA/TolQ/ExbB proton channel family protein [Myxococcales bacterium]|nr:MotA/TolQ/ExbB proton channel family protein [Myxococcales bacterium]
MVSFSPMHIWASMGLLSKVIASILVLMATMSLAVVVERQIAILRGARETRSFLRALLPLLEASRFDEMISLSDKHKASHFARIVSAVAGKLAHDNGKNVDVVELARREAERQKEAVGGDLRRGMGVLASVGSVAPFVGLLGTVVGIITAFQGIAATGSGGLGAVSAGIAEALVETALGLMVAIPAVLFFNQLNNKMNSVEAELARRTGELLDEVENSHGQRNSGELERAA